MDAEVEALEARVLMHTHEARHSHGENSTQTMLDCVPGPLPKFLMKEIAPQLHSLLKMRTSLTLAMDILV